MGSSCVKGEPKSGTAPPVGKTLPVNSQPNAPPGALQQRISNTNQYKSYIGFAPSHISHTAPLVHNTPKLRQVSQAPRTSGSKSLLPL